MNCHGGCQKWSNVSNLIAISLIYIYKDLEQGQCALYKVLVIIIQFVIILLIHSFIARILHQNVNL